ncbi:hypothetical protein NBRC116494_15170 [Aurantivibrio plasticivorans]
MLQKSLLRYLTLPLFVGGLSCSVNAQESEASDVTWYTVELILFRQGGNPDHTVEQWRNDIRMSYPLEWRSLIPQSLAPEPLVSDEEIQSLSDDSAMSLAASNGDNNPASEPVLNNEDDGVENDSPALIIGDDPLILLAPEELQLSEQVEKIQRNNHYRVLFHGGWHHPFVEREKERGIIISAGDRFDHHHELEGSIELKLQRYLHLTTNLWLTQFATNFGEESEWPELPWPPNRQRPIQDLSTNNWFTGGFNQSFNNEIQFDSLVEKSYVVKNIAPVEVTRRMRSNELHYIDHPLVGILVQFTPYDPLENVQEDVIAEDEGAEQNPPISSPN